MGYTKRIRSTNNTKSKALLIKAVVLIVLVGIIGGGIMIYTKLKNPITVEQRIKNELLFDESLAQFERETISSKAAQQEISPIENTLVSGSITQSIDDGNDGHVLDTFVYVTGFGSVIQSVSSVDLSEKTIFMLADTDTIISTQVEALTGAFVEPSLQFPISDTSLAQNQIALIPFGLVNSTVKMLSIDGSYYLDDFSSGALFRIAQFSGDGAEVFQELKLSDIFTADEIFKVNMTGVTALTRIMQRRLVEIGGDPLYFSAMIGDFLADADLTHVSNEVSFKDGCDYSDTSFCSPPEFIETLKASGVDLVELTGNHNNDRGSEYNSKTIELYRSLGWNTVGGGLNTEDAAKPFLTDTKGSKVAFLAYNFPDSPNGGAIAGTDRAGANSFDFERIELDILAAKESSQSVIVNVQYWECYAYPDGYVEFPQCDLPIGEQEQNFKKLIDLGADMVIGSSAHQPQTYELYKGKPIYYGLGNLYFDQSSWPGTKRGLVLTHYFFEGNIIQTKITPTVYDRDFQTRIMTDTESKYILQRLSDARDNL